MSYTYRTGRTGSKPYLRAARPYVRESTIRHGTNSGYARCRLRDGGACTACRGAHAEAEAIRRARKDPERMLAFTVLALRAFAEAQS